MKKRPRSPLIRVTSAEQKAQNAADLLTGKAVADYIRIIEGKAPAAAATIGGQQELTEQQRARLPYVLASKQPCLLCDAAPYAVNHWTIPEALADDRPDRVIFFSLCRICFGLPGVLQLVSQELLNRLSGERVKSPLIQPQ
jgi:hypothetical protein